MVFQVAIKHETDNYGEQAKQNTLLFCDLFQVSSSPVLLHSDNNQDGDIVVGMESLDGHRKSEGASVAPSRTSMMVRDAGCSHCHWTLAIALSITPSASVVAYTAWLHVPIVQTKCTK